MAESWVLVEWKTKRNVYLNGNDREVAGMTNTPFSVESGTNTFALLTAAREVEAKARRKIGIAPEDDPIVVVLRPV